MDPLIRSSVVAWVWFSLVVCWINLCSCQSFNATFLISRLRLPVQEISFSVDAVIAPCKKAGTWPVMGACADYVICRRTDEHTTIIEHYRCPPGLVFSTTSSQCRLADQTSPCFDSASITAYSPTTVATPLIGSTRMTKTSHSKITLKQPEYTSELSGLSCKGSGFFAHPTNSTKFYRCVALHLNSSFMIYLFSCEVGLLYEPTVGACVKSLGEEQMDNGGMTSSNESKTVRAKPHNSNVSDLVRKWEIERCRKTDDASTPTQNNHLFRSPVNCRRFFRCSSTASSLKVERFSCPTGLFFDESTLRCTWASETSSCNVLDTTDDLQITIDSPVTIIPDSAASISPSTAPPATTVTATLATIWFTNRPTVYTPPTTRKKTTILTDILFLYPEGTRSKTTRSTTTTATSTDVVSTTTPKSDMSLNLKQILRPTPYLTATGVLVVDGTQFKCQVAGTFPSANPCVFFKCERYVWLPTFLLFRFQCPPHTVFTNGTCQYSPTAECLLQSSSDQTNRTEMPVVDGASTSTLLQGSVGSTSNAQLCAGEGIFPVPYASPCSTRFMVCRYLGGPLHFSVDVNECPPSLVFSIPKRQCIDPVATNLNCITVAGTDTSFYDSTIANSNSSNDSPAQANYLALSPDESGGTAIHAVSQPCERVGFTRLSCHRFRRCQWLLPSGGSTVWVSYDFECGQGMVFDLSVTACIRPTEAIANMCQASISAGSVPSSTITSVSAIAPNATGDEWETLTPFMMAPAVIEESLPSTTDNSTLAATWTLPVFTDEGAGSDLNLPAVSWPASSTSPLPSLQQQSIDTPDVKSMFVLPNLELLDTSLASSTALPLFQTSTAFATQVKVSSKAAVCLRSGYFLYPADDKCQRFYRCLQLTPEPNSFVMLHYRCDDGFVFDGKYAACTAAVSSPSCLDLQQVSSPESGLSFDQSLASAGDTGLTTPLNQDSIVTTTQSNSNRLPVKILPQVWQMAGGPDSGSAALVCTTQRIYRLQTCGYYYSCIEKEKGKFRLQEIYCETLFLDIATGQCVLPPIGDPCNNPPTAALPRPLTQQTQAGYTSTIISSYVSPFSETPNTTTIPTYLEASGASATIDLSSNVTQSSTVPSSTISTSSTVDVITNGPTTTTRSSTPQVTSSTRRVTLGSLLVYSRRPSRPYAYRVRRPFHSTTTTETPLPLTDEKYDPPAVDDLPLPPTALIAESFTTPMSLSAYRETFNKLYAQLVNSQQDGATSRPFPLNLSDDQVLATTVQPALILNFNQVSGQLTNLTTGISFQCRSEGYFRNSRDVSCSKFYLCVKVGPRQYNLFEFMCLPHNGVQWRYNSNRNSCVDPQDVTEC